MNKYIIILTAVMTLSACATQKEKNLSQKLSEALNNVERKEVLYNACLTEAEWPVYANESKQKGRLGIKHRQEMRRKSEVTGMKELCVQMNDIAAKKPDVLSASCASKVQSKKGKGRKGWAEHASRIESICTQMLNLKTTN